jgi:hypothetical protein
MPFVFLDTFRARTSKYRESASTFSAKTSRRQRIPNIAVPVMKLLQQQHKTHLARAEDKETN